MASTHAKNVRDFLHWEKYTSDTQDPNHVLAWTVLRFIEDFGTDLVATANPVDDIMNQLAAVVGIPNHVLTRVETMLAPARKGLSSGNMSQFD